ncbi:MAG: methanol dehydrogenase [Rhodospirillales bacterium]|nr:methanol dehydrogenase [Rhodospirillales bacterium]
MNRGRFRLRSARASSAIIAVAVALLLVGTALAAIKLPALTGRVVDEAGALSDAQRSTLEHDLAAHEQRTGQQVVVAIVRSLQGVEIEDYGVDLIRGWGIGEKGKNTGAILLVAPNEKRVRVEVGYGLEGVLTDAASRIIIERTILPQIRRGDLPAGVVAGVHEMLRVLSGDVTEEDLAQRGPRATKDPGGGAAIFIFIAFFVFILWLASRRGSSGIRSAIWPIVFSSSWGRGGGGWSGGGGWGSGGGGFSGGGGSGGGGGASGSW